MPTLPPPPDSPTLGRRLVDVHMHFLPDCYRAALTEAGLHRLDGGMPIPTWSEDLALRTMDQLGIETAMLSVSSPSIRFVEGKAERALCRAVNLAGAEIVQRHPGRFGLFATLPLPDSDAALEEAAYALDELGADGVVIESNIRGIYLGDARLGPVFDALNARAAVVFLHPTSPACFASVGLGRPAPMIEFPIDTARTVVDLIFNGVFERCPDLKMIVPHGGGVLPALAPRFAAFATRSYIHPRPKDEAAVFATLASLYYDVVQSGHEAQLAALTKIAPLDHLLYGTDWPFGGVEGIRRNMQRLEASGLSEAALRGIARDNALRLFPRLALTCGCAG